MFHSARHKFVKRAWEKAQVNEKWDQSSWAKKIEAKEKVKAIVFLFLSSCSVSKLSMSNIIISNPVVLCEHFDFRKWLIQVHKNEQLWHSHNFKSCFSHGSAVGFLGFHSRQYCNVLRTHYSSNIDGWISFLEL